MDSSSKTAEELNVLLASEDDGRFNDHRDEFLSFLAPDTSNPEKRVKSRVIYWAYLKWCRLRRIEPIIRNRFFRGFTKLFKRKINRIDTFYYFYSDKLNISKEEKALAKQYTEQEREWHKEKQRRKKIAKTKRKQNRLKRKLLKNETKPPIPDL